jgi:hypothetical protein
MHTVDDPVTRRAFLTIFCDRAGIVSVRSPTRIFTSTVAVKPPRCLLAAQ